jgi:hypothetical protein
MTDLQRAVSDVLREYKNAGLYIDEMSDVRVRTAGVIELLWYGGAYIDQDVWWSFLYGGRNTILISKYVSGIRYFLRHEFAHCLAYRTNLVVGDPDFERAFGCHHDYNDREVRDEDCVSHYAMTSAGEDFAETVAAYLKDRGTVRYTGQVARKMQYIRQLAKRL